MIQTSSARLISDKVAGRDLMRPLLFLAALVITALLGIAGLTRALDLGLRNIQDGMIARPASGNVHIVEVDARSIAVLKQWPWPRSTHARAVDALSRAGASAILFDTDFSATTNPAEDGALAAAIARSKATVVLPTFRQQAGDVAQGTIESLPAAPFRDHAFLASVNVHPDPDGIMRRYSTGTVTGGVPRPSLAAVMSNFAGHVEQSFPIDTAIEPDTIPRHSYIDVIEGRVPPGALSGKQVLIGATAIELGDRYVLPRHGVLPGVVAQALAAETLMAGDLPLEAGWLPALLLALVPGWLLTGRRSPAASRLLLFGTAALVMAGTIGLQAGRIATLEPGAALMFLGTLGGMVSLLGLTRQLHQARYADVRTGLPNERQLIADLLAQDDAFIVVLRIGHSDAILAVLEDDTRRLLFQEIVQRMAPVTGGSKAYSLDGGQIGWIFTHDSARALQSQLEGAVALFVAPLLLGSRLQVVSPVFGFADFSITRQPAATALTNASLAASRAEEAGLRAVRYVDAFREHAGFEQRILADIGPAIARNELHMAYQPKWSIAQQRVCGFEALIRWTHPDLGRIMPDQFISVLEHAGRIDELTLYAIDTCAAQLRRWHLEGHDLGVAVNISAGLLSDPRFGAAAYQRVADLGPLARHLTFEITETVAFEETGVAADLLRKLRDLGLRVSVDDYGTGQSTLSYLKAFPANEIKVDKGFVLRMVQSPSDQILVRSTIELAHELGFTVVAEGVEDAATLALLSRYGCDVAQGWCIGKPLPVGEFDVAAINARMRNDLKMVA